MSKQQLLAYPYVEELLYRSKIDPSKFNLMIRSIEESVLRSILRGSESLETLNDLALGVESSYNALQSQASVINGYSHEFPGTLFATSFDVVISGRQDKVAGITTLPWDTNRYYTKIPRYDSDNDNIADQVSPSVQILVDGTPRAYENKAYNALNRSNKSFWIEDSSGDHEIEIRLPPSINKSFNYVEIVPFPMFGVQILEVWYQDPNSTDQLLYDSSDPAYGYAFYNNSGPLVMHVSPKETNGTFKIKAHVSNGALGFSSIDIAMIDYKDEPQTIYMKMMNLPARTVTKTYELQTLKLDFYPTSANDFSNFITEVAITDSDNDSGFVVSVDDLGNLNTPEGFNFKGSTIELLSSQNMYLKIKMREHNNTTPAIRGCKLTYEEVV